MKGIFNQNNFMRDPLIKKASDYAWPDKKDTSYEFECAHNIAKIAYDIDSKTAPALSAAMLLFFKKAIGGTFDMQEIEQQFGTAVADQYLRLLPHEKIHDDQILSQFHTFSHDQRVFIAAEALNALEFDTAVALKAGPPGANAKMKLCDLYDDYIKLQTALAQKFMREEPAIAARMEQAVLRFRQTIDSLDAKKPKAGPDNKPK